MTMPPTNESPRITVFPFIAASCHLQRGSATTSGVWKALLYRIHLFFLQQLCAAEDAARISEANLQQWGNRFPSSIGVAPSLEIGPEDRSSPAFRPQHKQLLLKHLVFRANGRVAAANSVVGGEFHSRFELLRTNGPFPS
jgi:hypothetical protein